MGFIYVPSVTKWSCCLGPGVSRWAQQEGGPRSVGMSAMGWVWGTGQGDGKVSQTEKMCQGLQGPQRVRYTKISGAGDRLRTESSRRVQRRQKPGEEAVPDAPAKEDGSGTYPGMGGKEIQTHTPPHPLPSTGQIKEICGWAAGSGTFYLCKSAWELLNLFLVPSSLFRGKKKKATAAQDT